MSKFRKRPVVIEAFQWTGGPDQLDDPVWIVEAIRAGEVRFDKGVSGRGGGVLPTLKIRTLEGVLSAQQGDWIIRGTAGELYPCKPEIFAAIYEPVEGDSETCLVLTNVEITPEMIDAGALAGWGERCPPAICRDLAERIYRAMRPREAIRETSHAAALAAKPESSDSQGGEG